MLARGESIGVFQFEGSGMREALRQVKPSEFEDLIALVALYRPGPMGYIPVYGRRKAGGEQVQYLDPRLEPITGPTYGICIYQEQYMEIAKQLAGFSPAEADDLRKAIGKKIHSLMASLKDKFLEGCAKNNVTPAVANQLWKDMEQAQDYSFNKSHAACYAMIAYRTAYLRANWPAEYMAALISSVMNTKDKVPFYVAACDEMGIEVLPPDVNVSAEDFRVVEEKIRFGLNAVKNVGETAVRAILAAREDGGPFTSIWDFCERVDPQVVNKRALESLVKSGAFDSTGIAAQGHARRARDRSRARDPHARRPPLGPGVDLRRRPGGVASAADRGRGVGESRASCLRKGIARPLRLRASAGRDPGRAPAEDRLRGRRARARRDGDIVTIGGIVGALRQTTTKKGDPMVFLRLDDVTGSVEAIVFNSVYVAARDLLEADRILVVKGRVDHKEGETKLIAIEVAPFEAMPERSEVTLRLDARKAPGGDDPRARRLLKHYPGEAPVTRRWRPRRRAADARVRARLPGAARARLLRRGEDAPRRGSVN